MANYIPNVNHRLWPNSAL